MVDKNLGDAANTIIIEDFLEGEEASFIVACDGSYYLSFASAQDHKRRDDGDIGPNTGGMGAYSPAPCITPAMRQLVENKIIHPTLAGMQAMGRPYTGFLYAGLMLTSDGPKVLEYNCRLGDPEAQAILMRLDSDFAQMIQLACHQRLHEYSEQWQPQFALGVVLASGGYPGDYRRHDRIDGLQQLNGAPVKVFHAGTTEEDGAIYTNGGRVLCVTTLASDVATAQSTANQCAECIEWPDRFYRHDIGHRAINPSVLS